MFRDKRVALKRTAVEYVAMYEEVRADLIEGFDILIAASLKNTMFLSENFEHAKYYNPRVREKETALQNLHVSYWKRWVEETGLLKFLSIKRTEEFEENCRTGNLPPFTVEEVFNFIATVKESAEIFTQETIDEMYRWLRPGAYRSSEYKTNQKNARWKLGKKIILSSMMIVHYDGRFHVNYHRDDHIKRLDRVFHALDGSVGKLEDSYQSPLCDLLNTRTVHNKYGETDYFSVACYKNGNLHLTFKRLDLVQQFNYRAGSGKHVIGDGNGIS